MNLRESDFKLIRADGVTVRPIIFNPPSIASAPELQKKVRCKPLAFASRSASLP